MAVLAPGRARRATPLLVAGLVVGYAVRRTVRFEFGGHYGTAEQLLFVPILRSAPLPFVPLLDRRSPPCSQTRARRDQAPLAPRAAASAPLADSWFCIPPVLVLAALAPGRADLGDAGVYALALRRPSSAATSAGRSLRNALLDRLPLRELVSDVARQHPASTPIFLPLAFLITVAAVERAAGPARRSPRSSGCSTSSPATARSAGPTRVELQRAYRGTVMLLSDVVESEDSYTAEHSRSVVELVNAVADELGRARAGPPASSSSRRCSTTSARSPSRRRSSTSRASSTTEEFEVMKTHTIEGQFLLDRVGGLLGRVGEIVRSCHERWDGSGYPDGLAGEQHPVRRRGSSSAATPTTP